MKRIVTLLLLTLLNCATDDVGIIENNPINESNLYFPPNTDSWEVTSIQSLGWNEVALNDLLAYLTEKNSKAFIILKNGKIVVEEYFNGTVAADNHPWNSAGKTLTAFTLGIAQQEGFLQIEDSSVEYLGSGWSSLDATQEQRITVRNHITMTTGLDYNVNNQNCTDAACLSYLNQPNAFWYYHNAPYSLTQQIISSASNSDFTPFFNSKLRDVIGMQGAWIKLGYNNVYYSNARSMARFGLLNLNQGNWNDIPVLTDKTYFSQMVSSSQSLNEAYGYLWWLNGKNSFKSPASTLLFQGSLITTAPADLYAALGKDDQKLYVVPSKNLVVVRLGGNAGESLLGPSSFDTALWEKLSALIQ